MYWVEATHFTDVNYLKSNESLAMSNTCEPRSYVSK
jgi:hypothetical protein